MDVKRSVEIPRGQTSSSAEGGDGGGIEVPQHAHLHPGHTHTHTNHTPTNDMKQATILDELRVYEQLIYT